MSFAVATYNVLATAYINPQWYPGVPEHLLRPETRVPALVRHVEALGADVLCLQEVEPYVFTALADRLGARGYAGYFEQKARNRPDGCATFVRTEFAVRTARRLEYHDCEAGGAVHSGHVALLLTLERDARSLGVANTHIRWMAPNTPREEQVGFRQVEELIATCRDFEPPCENWIACGDFNYPPDSEAVRVMRNAGYAFAHADRPHVRSAVANGRAKLIDYLFHTVGLRARAIDPPPVRDDTKLPSAEQPSDHLALVAEFDWADR